MPVYELRAVELHTRAFRIEAPDEFLAVHAFLTESPGPDSPKAVPGSLRPVTEADPAPPKATHGTIHSVKLVESEEPRLLPPMMTPKHGELLRKLLSAARANPPMIGILPTCWLDSKKPLIGLYVMEQNEIDGSQAMTPVGQLLGEEEQAQIEHDPAKPPPTARLLEDGEEMDGPWRYMSPEQMTE